MLRISAAVAATLMTFALTGCFTSARPAEEDRAQAKQSAPSAEATGTPRARPREPTSTLRSRPTSKPRSLASDGSPRRSALTIPAIGLRTLPVVPYRGSPDDGPGTRIQDQGVAASPQGPDGGTGPGGVGNYIVTAHRTSSTRAFEDLPRLRVGQRVHVVVGRTRYTYRVVDTRTTSFRSARSLARQSSPVPGHPGRRPTRAMITLSTCATPEDHARGNYWADEFGNPEHRIDKIGVLVAARPA